MKSGMAYPFCRTETLSNQFRNLKNAAFMGLNLEDTVYLMHLTPTFSSREVWGLGFLFVYLFLYFFFLFFFFFNSTRDLSCTLTLM